jgi:hypothetical protein
MNRIRVARLILSALVTLVVFIVVELLWEPVLTWALWRRLAASWGLSASPIDWSLAQQLLNIGIALVNTIMMMWLYVALRPMFGVGPLTALIASGFAFAFVTAFTINYVNLGRLQWPYAVVETVNLIVELPIAMIAGASVYESGRWALSET